MFKTDFARTVSAALCSIVVSATCVLAAVAPATSAPVASMTHIVA
jgi:hypothetical protein